MLTLKFRHVARRDFGLAPPRIHHTLLSAYLRPPCRVLRTFPVLDILASRRFTNCAGVNRRDFLRVGALGATGLTLSNLLRARAAGASGTDAKDTTVIWLFLSGGPTHFETFDPKPGNPAPNTSVVGSTKTDRKSTHIGGLFPNLADWADKFSIIRSEEHTSELQSHSFISYAVFCLKK